jgi:peptide/nickel transport system substrate-binding protein
MARWRACFSLCFVLVLLSACAPQAQPAQTSAPAQGSAPSAQSGPKTLRLAMDFEPRDFLLPARRGTSGGEFLAIADAQLTVFDSKGDAIPRLAAEVPSIEKGTWRVAPDGTMQVTWKLRPGVTWHDGRPLTTDDFLFGWEYLNHPGAVITKRGWTASAERIEALDASTMVVHFKQIDVTATESFGGGQVVLRAFPRHLIGAAFAAGDIDAFHGHAYWKDSFVGLGPYKLAKRELGSHAEFVRFDDYLGGRPPLDRIIARYYFDPGTLLAAILAGEVDTYDGPSVNVSEAVELQKRWQGTRNQVLLGPEGSLQSLAPQFRPDVVTLKALLDRPVRQALYRALDREAANQVATQGLAQVADSWIPPDDPRRQMPAFRDAIVQYPFDLARAQRELEDLGWRKGPDGILVNPAGERFEFEIRLKPESYAPGQLAVFADTYKKIGVSIIQTIKTPQQMTDREWTTLYPGMRAPGNPYTNYEAILFNSKSIAGPANRYNGQNRNGYVNPEMDALLDRLAITIPSDERARITADIARIGTTDLPVLPILWEVHAVIAGEKVRNVQKPSPVATGNWELPTWEVIP